MFSLLCVFLSPFLGSMSDMAIYHQLAILMLRIGKLLSSKMRAGLSLVRCVSVPPFTFDFLAGSP